MSPRSNASFTSVVSLSCLLLCGCDSASSSSGPSGGTASSGGSPASGGATAGGSAISGGAPSQVGSPSSGGNSGTATGGASGALATGGAPPQAGSPSSGGSSGTATGGASGALATGGAAATGGATTGNGSCAGALICEDFEAYTGTPGAPWKVLKNAAGNVIIDSAQHRSGTNAVKFTTTGAADYQQAYISLSTIFPIANNAFYGRMMIYTTKAANDGVHWTMIEGEGAATAQGITSAKVRYGGQHQQKLMANYDTSGKASDCWQHSATKMPEGKWACMEWYFNGSTNTQKFWLDGLSIDDLTVIGQGDGCLKDDTQGKWIYPNFARLDLGWESYATDDPREVWIDDVAIGTSQIGCPQ
jgi:polysaccharide lyase-like protein